MPTDIDVEQMKKAISWAERCRPISRRIPKVGAIVAVGGVVIGQGHRGTGPPGDDEHAEKNALAAVNDKSQLPSASVYTTLEPCTPSVRSDPLDCCTERLCQAGVRKVFIGILDPNQAVTGKGLWELQSRGIEVELFPPELARKIRSLNDEFIREQQTLGIVIMNTVDGQIINTRQSEGQYTLKGTYLNAPGPDVFVLTSIGSKWWPQPYNLTSNADGTWSSKIHVGSYEPHTISIVRANELGSALIEYYRKISAQNADRQRALARYATEKSLDKNELLGHVGQLYPGIEMARLPKGLQLQAQVTVTIEQPPK
jgi:pyrimidine deaminase RibD-like protein